MSQVFTFRTDTPEKTYQHTVHAAEPKSAIDQWILQLEDQQDKSNSLSASQVQQIKEQYHNGQMNVQLGDKASFLAFWYHEHLQLVYINEVNEVETAVC